MTVSSRLTEQSKRGHNLKPILPPAATIPATVQPVGNASALTTGAGSPVSAAHMAGKTAAPVAHQTTFIIGDPSNPSANLVKVRGVRGFYDPISGDHHVPGAHGGRPKKKATGGSSSKGVKLAKGSKARVFDIDGVEFRIWSPEAGRNEDLMRGLGKLAKYPGIHPFVAIMPDHHLGESSINGSVIPSVDTLYVNAIGGDIGCGMTCVKLPITVSDIGDKLEAVYKSIYARVPTGRRTHTHPSERITSLPLFQVGLEIMTGRVTKKAMQQFGTLGAGNHFVNIMRNASGEIYLMLHTGSRGLGQHVRTYGVRNGVKHVLPRGLVTLDANSDAGRSYFEHVQYATRYASANRMEILRQAILAFQEHVGAIADAAIDSLLLAALDVPHNYVAREELMGKRLYVHRKGAIRVGKDELGIIPGSMGTSSYIVRGRGNEASLMSSSHGAGRKMTPYKAMQSIRPEDFEAAMRGILVRRDQSAYKEAPQAYKTIAEVMRWQKDLVAKEEELFPLAVVIG